MKLDIEQLRLQLQTASAISAKGVSVSLHDLDLLIDIADSADNVMNEVYEGPTVTDTQQELADLLEKVKRDV